MPTMLQAAGVAWLIGGLALGCAGGTSSPAPAPPSSGGGASSGPRLHWDQSAPDAADLSLYSYVLYVDGALVLLGGSTCGALAADTLAAPCSAPLPALTAGSHTLEMATRLTRDGATVESARSAPVLYAAGAAAFGSETAGAVSSNAGTVAGAAVVVEAIFTGLDQPSALAQLTDGRLLVAERGGRIRIAEGGRLREEPAAWLPEADTEGGARVGLAIAPDFDTSRHVFVSYARVDAEGMRHGRVVRFRETAGSLGEMAVMIDDLPAEPDAPILRIGPDGALYVGTSARDDFEPADFASYAGKILRFSLDGTTPADNPVASSPVYSFGFRGLSGFDLSEAGSLWHVEGDGAGAWLGRAAAGQQAERLVRLGSTKPSGMALHTGAASPDWRGSLFVALPGQRCLLRVSGLDAPAPAIERIAQGLGRIVAVLTAGDGLYIAGEAGGGASAGVQTGTVYRIRELPPRR